MKVKKRLIFALILLLAIAQATALYAAGSGGFENATYNAKGLGRGGAFVADADNPSAVCYNPAGMSQLKGYQITTGMTGVNLITDYHADPGGVNARSASKLAFIPNLYTTLELPVVPVNFGFGMNAPYGLKNQYSSTSPFRYVGYKNELSVLAYTLAGSIRLMPRLAVGAAAVYYNADLKQKAKLNSDRITQGVIPGWPFVADAPLSVDAEANGWGWTLGSLWTVTDKHQIGFNYRSQARLHFKGHLNVEDLDGPVMLGVFGNRFFSTPVTTDITLPPQFTIAYKYQITHAWDAELDLAYTRWSTFDRQEYTFGTPNAVLLGMSPIPQGFHDTFNLHLGSDWNLNKYLTLRGGYFFYQSPGRNANTGPVIPNASWNGIAAGCGINFKSLTLDMTYLIELAPTRHVKDTSVGDASGVVAEGKYDNFIQLFSFGLTYRFGG